MSTFQNPEDRTQRLKHLAPGPPPSSLLLSPICAITASERLSCSAPLPGTGMRTSILAWDLSHPQLFPRSLSWLPCQSFPGSSYRDSPPPSNPLTTRVLSWYQLGISSLARPQPGFQGSPCALPWASSSQYNEAVSRADAFGVTPSTGVVS